MAYFPMFVDITEQKCLVIGGGRIALRKISVLLDFGARIVLVAPEVCEEIKKLEEGEKRLTVLERNFLEEDLESATLVIVATSDSIFNRELSSLCRKRRIPVNVVDCKEECSFILPAYVKEDNLVAAFSSAGNSPAMTQYLKEKEAEILTPFLGEVNEYLGMWRPRVQELFPTESERKAVFLELLSMALEKKELPTEEEALSLIEKHRRVE